MGHPGGHSRAQPRDRPLRSGRSRPRREPSQAVSLRGHDLRYHPDTAAIDVVSGTTQFGRSRDDFGPWFGNNNSNPIWQYALEDRYLRRMQAAVAEAQAAKAASADAGGAAETTLTDTEMQAALTAGWADALNLIKRIGGNSRYFIARLFI